MFPGPSPLSAPSLRLCRSGPTRECMYGRVEVYSGYEGKNMTKNRITLRAMGIALAASTLAATITVVLIGGSWLAFTGWLIFFASLQLPLLLWLATTDQLDRCSVWLLGR